MKKKLILIYIPICYILFIATCAPRIKFEVKTESKIKPKLFISGIEDMRPPNEKMGYKIFYIESISDDDYENGFLKEFTGGVTDAFSGSFTLVNKPDEADMKVEISVRHFYGEYSRTVKTVLWEKGSWCLLLIPRIFSDAIPYNHFAGRVSMDFIFIGKSGVRIDKTVDARVTGKVSTYNRGSSHTASRLSEASSSGLNRIIREVIHGI